MKEKTKRNKGITLIALILTIIVLLILAVVAISAVKGDGIIGHAKNAKTDYTKAQKNEQDMLTQYEYEIEKSQGTVTVAYGEYATNKELNEKIPRLKLGDKVNYVVPTGKTYNGEWRVIGIDNGQIKLVATSNVTTKEISGKDEKWNEETGSYKNAEDALDKICEEYLNESYATAARSIRVEDINKITSYNPPTPYEMTYKRGTDGIVMYKKEDSEEFKANNYSEKFRKPTETENITAEEEYTVKNNYYMTFCSTSASSVNYANSSAVYNMLLANNDGTYRGYWLASSFSHTEKRYATFGLRYVYSFKEGGVNVGPADSDNGCLWNTAWYDGKTINMGVRPIVSLNTDITLTETSTGSGEWNISK